MNKFIKFTKDFCKENDLDYKDLSINYNLDFLDLKDYHQMLEDNFTINEIYNLLDIKEIYNNESLMLILESVILSNLEAHLYTLTIDEIEDLRDNSFGLYNDTEIINAIDNYVFDIETD